MNRAQEDDGEIEEEMVETEEVEEESEEE